MDCSPQGFSVHGISQEGILEWVAISSSRGSSQPRDQTCVSHIRWILYHWAPREGHWSLSWCLKSTSSTTSFPQPQLALQLVWIGLPVGCCRSSSHGGLSPKFFCPHLTMVATDTPLHCYSWVWKWWYTLGYPLGSRHAPLCSHCVRTTLVLHVILLQFQ